MEPRWGIEEICEDGTIKVLRSSGQDIHRPVALFTSESKCQEFMDAISRQQESRAANSTFKKEKLVDIELIHFLQHCRKEGIEHYILDPELGITGSGSSIHIHTYLEKQQAGHPDPEAEARGR